MGTFFPHHYITYGNRHALVRISENGSIMKSMAMVDFFIVNKGTFFPYHYITYENRHALVHICKNGWLMKSMAMVDFFIENKDTLWSVYMRKWVDNEIPWLWSTSSLKIKELSSHIITLPMETDTLWSIICKNGSIMKSMAMVDFFIENKGTFFPYHYITYENRHALVHISKNGWLMKSMAMVDFFIENKDTLWSLYAKNGSLMKSMTMVDFFIENKDTLWSSIYAKNGSIMKSMAMVDFFIENKGTFFPHHDITYGNRHSLVRSKKNRSIMKSMAMVDFFIENKGTFFPYHYITYGNRHALVHICKNGSLMKSMAMVDFFIENKGKLQLKQQDIINHTNVGKGVNFLCKWELSSHIITLPMETDTLWSVSRKWVDNEIHGNGRLLH
ncbi:hypothetical protein H6P81_021516 [Aristolochia fimbriata]|uniref:Uncharacterized protein n=1 Tax=Aristolochia fimbriata TaxID=158543 RepID=A0AAV7DQS0_ARIFI|nr:hypothetical protein H6P81_021516 [Aristolochia fimbriata]